jgi:uncharacterized membrane protein
MSTACPAASDPMNSARDTVFERILVPHRSLPPRGFHVMMLLLGLLSVVVGVVFVSLGCWPIFGFFGLDVLGLYIAFRLSYRGARRREILRLARDDFTVERIDIYGERRMWRFQPFWLRVVLEEKPDESNRLFIASHGRRFAIGDFLGAPTRRELAEALSGALRRWRAALNPANGA